MVALRYFFLCALLLAAGVMPRTADAQWSAENLGLTDASYTSPTWGYAVRWHGAEWTAERQESSGGDDLLQLRNANGEIIRYEGTARFGDDPVACRARLFDDLTRSPGVSDLDVVPGGLGNLIWFQSPAQANGLYIFRLQRNGIDADWTRWIDCRSLVPGQAVLAITHLAPATSLAPMDELTVIPSRRSVFPYADQAQVPAWPEPFDCMPGQIADWLSEARFTRRASPTPGMQYVWILLRYYHEVGSDEPLTADASTIFLRDTNDVVSWPVEFAWAGGPPEPTAARQTIPPGYGADLSLTFEIPAAAQPARVQNAPSGRQTPSLADSLGCLNMSNGAAVWPQSEPPEPGIRFVFDPDGAERGMVAWLDGTSDPTRGDLALLAFANTGQTPWTVDLGAITADPAFAIEPVRPPTRPLSVLLDADPAAAGSARPADGSITLAPGEQVVVRFAFPPGTLVCSRLLYVPVPNQWISLAELPCGGRGAGAAPIIRTGE